MENKKEKKVPQARSRKQPVPAARTKKAPERKQTVEKAAKPVQKRGHRRPKKEQVHLFDPVRVIPLGGLGEIGKNITVYECGNDAIIVDCGISFPDSEMPGVDLVIPDLSYVERIKDKVRGIFITHGHEDHIGGVPYLLRILNVPLYGTRLTCGLIENKLKEHGLASRAKLMVTNAGQTVKAGCFSVEFVRVNHSIPDAVGFAITTPAGVIVQTGDFKIDFTPIEGKMIDLARFGELGKAGVLALLPDSTNAERPGATISERQVAANLRTLFERGDHQRQRIIVASFASNIHRVKQIMDCAAESGRKVALSGRSMLNVVETAMELGYLSVPENLLIDISEVGRYPANRICIITTGSQGEPMAALSRMASGEHRQVRVGKGDLIIISANPIPGNEKLVGRVVNELLKLGADVIYERRYEVHVSGHACQDELKMMMSLTQPKYFLPLHGEYKHLKKHAALAESMGIPEENILIAETGNVIEFSPKGMHITGSVQSGQVMVDGLGIGDVGSIVLRDRKLLAEDGIIIVVMAVSGTDGHLVSGPNIVSRGFVYVKESEQLMEDARHIATEVVERCLSDGRKEYGMARNKVKDAVSETMFQKTKRRPMVLPVIMEV